jgi:hypothetical protein
VSATSLAAVIGGKVVELAAVAGAWDLFRRDKIRLSASKATAEADSALPPARPDSGISARPGDRALREAGFADLRAAGKTVAEAGELAGIKPRTARTYEKRRLAALDGTGI